MTTSADALVIGAGIVGAACAWELARRGLRVEIVAPGPVGGGATAEGMGHLILLDDSEAQIELLKLSMRLWREFGELSAPCELQYPGTLWVAADDEELAAARQRAKSYQEQGVRAEILDAAALQEAEPHLRPGLAGGLRVPDDGIVFPPAAAAELVRRAVDEHGARHRLGRVVQVENESVDRKSHVTLDNGERLEAGLIVNAAGIHALDILSAAPRQEIEVEMVPRKGHLLITARYPGYCRHQLIELGYLKSAHGTDDTSVAFNLQPRPNGQLLLGSSRQFGIRDRAIDSTVVGRMVRRALSYAPTFKDLQIVRAWTGFRAATDDHMPLIGAVPDHSGLFMAAGLEGLGVTAAPAVARLVADEIEGKPSEIDRSPYQPGRRGISNSRRAPQKQVA